MRFAHPQNPRRGAFLFIALFSCLQITLGFFLIMGNGPSYVAPIQIADMAAEQANAYEPAAGDEIVEMITYRPAINRPMAPYKVIIEKFNDADEYSTNNLLPSIESE